MGKTHYVAVHTDSGCVCGCEHKHPNITTAVACISEPGGYIVAVRRRKFRALTEAEELEFQRAMYGHREEHRQKFPRLALLLDALKTHG